MSSLVRHCRCLKREEQGAVIVEFALLAPVLIAMMLGILQIGLTVQNYSAVRNVSADVARYAMIQYINGHPMTEDSIETQAQTMATGAPYLLSPNRLTVDAQPVTTPQVTGTTEKTLTITYRIPTIVDSFGLHGPQISYSRSLIVSPSA
jgi:Flp pilus assembly protein TadG